MAMAIDMDIALLLYTTFSILSICLIYKLSRRRSYRLPPSPAGALPVLGHLHLLKPPLHRTLHRLSQISGPIFSLKLGFRRLVVVSSPNLAEECFSKNDIVLANRPRTLIDKYVAYNHTTISGAPYGEHWRSLRRIAAQELLSVARLNAFLHIRQDEINRLLLNLWKISDPGFSKVELRPLLSQLTFNVMMRMIAGERYISEDEESEQGQKCRKLINHVFELAQASNPQDFLPFLQWIDFGGFTKELASLAKQTDEFFQRLVDEHRREKRNTMIGHLLSLQESEPQFYSDQTIKGLILSMLLAGTDTSSVTLEWAISLLLNHPHVLKKTREELDAKVGMHRLINEEDLSNFPYLRNVILETFRLFPAAPLLVPHESTNDCRVGGYDIPRGTMLFVNAWAIHRDPDVWDEATNFKPERFEGVEVEVHKLLPFGMGRRACPGSGLGQRMVGLALGSLIQCFEWERMDQEEVDLAEGIGLTMPKLKPLEVMCKPREIMYKVFK
ncbi:Cytochrome P450 CYP2 subfamily [Handroanthus impetiginosus]|uniref:(+)-piperitol/(+)-sesamin synthase n=1 Tax=Handroanthus impetiginosus TaxID=429701 RepID=A0A2G9HHV6_9LAMI|nr:Cytochrome P450 CYP2 subfamily [Handroanthus impetiginosus]